VSSSLHSIRRFQSFGLSTMSALKGEHTFRSAKTTRFLVAMSTVVVVCGIAVAGRQHLAGALPVLAEYWALISVSAFAVLMLVGAFAMSVRGGLVAGSHDGARYFMWSEPGSDGCDDGD
jgi:hypothetical protein